MKKLIVVVMGLLLMLAGAAHAAAPAAAGKSGQGTVEGVFLVPGGAVLAHGIVSFFNKANGPPSEVSDLRRVPDMVTRTDGAGKFRAQLPAGSYYLGALEREVGKGPGPPQAGEKYFFALQDGDNFRLFAVQAGKELAAGQVAGVVPTKVKALKKAMTISGTVRDEEGKPFANGWVTVKKDLDSPRPQYISVKTAADGRYEMKIPPGRYYVMVRDSMEGKRPLPGTYLGIYGKKSSFQPAAPFNIAGKLSNQPPGGGFKNNRAEAVAVSGKAGQERAGIDVTMFKIPVPEEVRKKFEAAAQGGDK